jgi:hypothetical protein
MSDDLKDYKSKSIVETIGDETTVATVSSFKSDEPAIAGNHTQQTYEMGEAGLEKKGPRTLVDPDSERVKYSSGAQRSTAVEHLRYDLIHPLFTRTIAQVMAEGAEKYGPYNWEQGFPISTLFNHLLAHLFNYQSGDRSEDHLGHASCNMMFLVVEAQLRYDQNRDQLRLENCQLSPEMIQAIKDFQEKRKQAIKDKSSIDEHMKLLIKEGSLVREEHSCLPLQELIDEYFPKHKIDAFWETLDEAGYEIHEGQLLHFDFGIRVSKSSSDAISLKLLSLYQKGTVRHAAGCWVPFKDFVRLYFNEFSYTNVRKVFADCGIVVNENDQLINFAIKENNAG